MPRKTFTVKFDTSKLRIEAFKKEFIGASSEVLFDVINEVLVPAIRTKLEENNSIYTGKLSKAIRARIQASKTKSIVNVGPVGVPYALEVEQGSRPRTVKRGRILRYVKAKMGLTGTDAIRVTNSIVKTIEIRGTIPHPYLVNTFDALKSKIVRTYLRRLRQRLRL